MVIIVRPGLLRKAKNILGQKKIGGRTDFGTKKHRGQNNNLGPKDLK